MTQFYVTLERQNPITHVSKYHAEMKILNSKFIGVSTKGSTIRVILSAAPTMEEVTAFTAADAAFVDSDPAAVVQASILIPALKYAEELILHFTSENIVMGITQAGKTEAVAAHLSAVLGHLKVGSLYAAESAVAALTTPENLSPFITADRLNSFRNKIRAYLGLTPI